MTGKKIGPLRGRGKRPRALARLAVLAALAAALPGFSNYFPGGLFRSLEVTSYLHRPARITRIRSMSAEFGAISDVAAVVLNYKGQNLRVESSDLIIGADETGTLLDVIEGEPTAHEFRFFQVRNLEGRTVGYLLARDNWLQFVAMEKNGNLYLVAHDPAEP